MSLANCALVVKRVTGDTSVEPNTAYIADSSSSIVFSVPDTFPDNAVFGVESLGSGGWSIAFPSVSWSVAPDIYAINSNTVRGSVYLICTSNSKKTFSLQSAYNTSYSVGGVRGVFSGGITSGSYINTISYISIATLGTAYSFGILTSPSRGYFNACSSSTRGIIEGGQSTGGVSATNIDYITVASTGNASNFGTLATATYGASGFSSSTRGVFGGGYTVAPIATCRYYTIATIGSSGSFGYLGASRFLSTGCCSPTRGITAGGSSSAVIEYCTIATVSSYQNFGNALSTGGQIAACSSSIKGLISYSSDSVAMVGYILFASIGDASNFGNLVSARKGVLGCSSEITGIFAGGTSSAAIDYFSISSASTASNFGTMLSSVTDGAGLSNGHGGLQ